MLHRIRTNYDHTLYASYLGYITQAIVNNFAPLLFLTFAADYGLSLAQITLLTTLNFAVQLCVDLLSARVMDRIGYRPAIVAAHGFAAAGLVGLAVLPCLLGAYPGLLAAVVLYAIGGGIIEVLISPIVEACPTKKKDAAMSLLHSFYCWGHLGVVLLSTAFFTLAGIGRWRWLAAAWAAVPLCNLFYFTQVPIYRLDDGENGPLSLGGLLRSKTFWLLTLLMVCAGASEQAMSQWASAFAEAGLGVSKTVGDLAGPCAFALCMGTARALYGRYSEKLSLKPFMAGSAVLCLGCYAVAVLAPASLPLLGLVGCAVCGFSVGIFWPGTFSLAAVALPGGGTAMYALMALAGDVGCSGGPTLVGLVAGANGGRLQTGLALAAAFPLVLLLALGRVRAGEPQNTEAQT